MQEHGEEEPRSLPDLRALEGSSLGCYNKVLLTPSLASSVANSLWRVCRVTAVVRFKQNVSPPGVSAIATVYADCFAYCRFCADALSDTVVCFEMATYHL